MQSTVRAVSADAPSRRRVLDLVVLVVGVFLLAVVATALGWQYWHADRIYSGVTVAGVPVGGRTRAEAIARLNQTVVRQPLPPMLVSYGERQWPVAAGQATATIDTFDAVNKAYLVGRRGPVLARLGEQLRAALGAVSVQPPLNLDVPQVRYALGQIAAEVRSPARSGVVVNDVRIAPQPGVDVDVDSTLESLMRALEGGLNGAQVVAPLQTVMLEPPPEIVESTAKAEQTMATISSGPLLLRDARYGYEFALDAASLEELIYSRQPLRLDEDKVRSVLENWAAQIDIEPADARLRFDPATSSVQVIQNSRMGRALDIEGTLESIRSAVESGSMAGALVMRDLLPAVDSRNVAQMGIRELVASGTSYFAGSSPARVRNIEVAAEKFEGVVIPPNGVFSFNENVEDVTAANGFEDSLIIWGDRTAVGVGGGVCQVSTTVFRAAYEAGLPILERYNHGYVVSWYGEPGLDATIYTPSVDFKFRNDTGAYLLVEPVVDAEGGTITFNLYGTKPDRVVTISEPQITDVIEPEPPVYRFDESLGYGEREQVDWEQKGLTAQVTRTIVENGQTRTETLVSKYQPWRAVYLYGPGVDVPATPSVSPRLDAAGETDSAQADSVTDTSEDTAANDASEGAGFALPTPTAPAPAEPAQAEAATTTP